MHDTYVGWVEALRNAGQHVVEYNLDERLTLYASALKQIGEATFTRMLTAEQSYELAVNGLYSTLYKARPEFLRVILATDGHAPDQYRADTVRNLDAWYTAFNVQPSRKLYLAPDARVRVW